MKTVFDRMKAFWHNEDGIGTLEIILIIAVIIIIALIFKDWIIKLVNELLGKANSESKKIFD